MQLQILKFTSWSHKILIQQRLSDVQAEGIITSINCPPFPGARTKIMWITSPLATIHHESHGYEEETKTVTMEIGKWFCLEGKHCFCPPDPTKKLLVLLVNWIEMDIWECEIAKRGHALEIQQDIHYLNIYLWFNLLARTEEQEFNLLDLGCLLCSHPWPSTRSMLLLPWIRSHRSMRRGSSDHAAMVGM